MPEFSPRLLRGFVQTVCAELGVDGLPAVLDKAGLPSHLADPAAVARIDASAAAQAYADIQRALRLYFGRGARGILLRVGTQFWKRVLDDAPLSVKPQITMARTLATAAHPKPALDLLAKLLSAKTGGITIHTLDLDFLLVDHASPAAHEQHDDEPICWVTISLIRACIHWATGRELDVTERTCRAMGAPACEFHIKTGA